MGRIRWTADRLDQLERAVRDGLRVVLSRRGTEYVVIAVSIKTEGRREALIGRLPMTGEEMAFRLEDLDEFQIVGA
jgi:hypothetical protein